jgi:hypothetical protein
MMINNCFRSYSLILILILPCWLAKAQTLADYQQGLALKIDNSDIRKLERAVEDIKEGFIEADKAHTMFQELSEKEKNQWKSSGHKKVLRQMADASELVQEGHLEIYDIYNEYCEAFWETTRDEGYHAAGMNKAKYYERKARKEISTSKRNREYVQSSDNYNRATSKFKQATELEKLAIRDKGRALQIYQDFPVEYNYGWEDDVDAETVAAFFADEYVVEPDEDKAARVDTVVVKQVDTVFLAEKEESARLPDTIAESENLKWLPDVIFKVQVAAHTEPISDAEVRQIYKGKERVNVVYEDNWYKYQIGPYDNYTDAKQVLNTTDVENAFIVPYLDGKKLTIEQALKKEEAKANN